MGYIYKIKSFNDLKNNLETSGRLLLQQQILLMHDKTESAQLLFEEFYTYRKAHLIMMENLLLPAFEKVVKDDLTEGAKPLYFIREKALILKELENLVRKLGNLVLHTGQLDIVALFEEYAAFKDLLDHHDAREKAFLFPILDEKLDVIDKGNLLKKIEESLHV